MDSSAQFAKKTPGLWRQVQLTLGALKTVPRVLSLLRSASPRIAGSLVLVMVGQSLLPGAMAWVGKLIVDAVVAAARLAPGREHDVACERLFHYVVFEFGLMVTQTILSRAQTLLRDLLRATLGNHFNTLILEKATHLSMRHFEDADVYDKMQNARREAGTRPLNLVLELASLGQQGLSLVSYSLLLFHLSPWSVALIALASLPAFLAEARLSGQAFRLNTARAPEARRFAYLEWILTRESYAKEVKLLGLAPLVLGRYRSLFRRFFEEDRRLAVKRTAAGLSLGALSLLAFYGSYAAVAARAARADITLGDLTLYLSLFRLGQASFQSVLASVSSLYESGLFLSNLFAYLDIEVDQATRTQPPRTLPSGEPQAIELHDVSFRYPAQKGQTAPPPWAIRNLSLRIAPGEKLALVGDNGAGKSTLIKLLLRLYEPTEGSITYGGVDLRDLAPADLRARIGVLFQDFVRYQFTAAENIGLGDVARLEDRQRIEEAAQAAGAAALVRSLPQGLDTKLGGWFEEGHGLSGGQWQRIALARTFMRDAELLVLDEPSAALDAEAEAEVFVRLQRLARDRTAILISHRFSTVRTADRIVVLEGGCVSEQGSHAELLAQSGRYARLFRLQAQGYKDSSTCQCTAALGNVQP